jgi:hypothetical protein
VYQLNFECRDARGVLERSHPVLAHHLDDARVDARRARDR